MIALVADDADDSVWNRTLLDETLVNENIEIINNASKDNFYQIIRNSMEYLGYSYDSALNVVHQYIDFLATAYTDNNLVDLDGNESYYDLFSKAFENGALEKYAHILGYFNDLNTFKADTLYFLGEYGAYLDDASIKELSDILGKEYSELTEDINAIMNTYKYMYKTEYSYTSKYIISCIEKVTAVITENENQAAENQLTVPESDQPFEGAEPNNGDTPI